MLTARLRTIAVAAVLVGACIAGGAALLLPTTAFDDERSRKRHALDRIDTELDGACRVRDDRLEADALIVDRQGPDDDGAGRQQVGAHRGHVSSAKSASGPTPARDPDSNGSVMQRDQGRAAR